MTTKTSLKSIFNEQWDITEHCGHPEDHIDNDPENPLKGDDEENTTKEAYAPDDPDELVEWFVESLDENVKTKITQGFHPGEPNKISEFLKKRYPKQLSLWTTHELTSFIEQLDVRYLLEY